MNVFLLINARRVEHIIDINEIRQFPSLSLNTNQQRLLIFVGGLPKCTDILLQSIYFMIYYFYYILNHIIKDSRIHNY